MDNAIVVQRNQRFVLYTRSPAYTVFAKVPEAREYVTFCVVVYDFGRHVKFQSHTHGGIPFRLYHHLLAMRLVRTVVPTF
jgi:hypothetical protein